MTCPFLVMKIDLFFAVVVLSKGKKKPMPWCSCGCFSPVVWHVVALGEGRKRHTAVQWLRDVALLPDVSVTPAPERVDCERSKEPGKSPITLVTT